MSPISLEWSPLASLVAKSQEPRGCLRRLSDTVRQVFNIANVTNPEDEGVIDHMVSVTTAMRSPFIAVACHTVSNEDCIPFKSFQPPLPPALLPFIPPLQSDPSASCVLPTTSGAFLTGITDYCSMSSCLHGQKTSGIIILSLSMEPKHFNPLPKT